MKKNSKIITLVILLAFLGVAYVIYQPPKEDTIYRKELKFTGDGAGSKLSDEDRIIQRAKETLKTSLNIEIIDNEFEEKVAFDSRSKYNFDNDIVIVWFYELARNNEVRYTLIYDTKSGQLVEFHDAYDARLEGSSPLDEAQLKQTAKTFYDSAIGDGEIAEAEYSSDVHYLRLKTRTKNSQVYDIFVNIYTDQIQYYYQYSYPQIERGY